MDKISDKTSEESNSVLYSGKPADMSELEDQQSKVDSNGKEVGEQVENVDCTNDNLPVNRQSHSSISDDDSPESDAILDKFPNISTAMKLPRMTSPSPGEGVGGRAMTPRRRERRQSQMMLSLSEARGSFFMAQEDLLDKRLKARRKIRRIFRFVHLVCSLSIRMQQLSRDLVKDDVISQLYYYSANGVIGESGVRKLAFDPADFSRRRMARLPVWARKIACKDPKERTETEVEALCRLLKGVRSFQEKFTEEMRLKICKVARYSSCEKGRVLVRQGHDGYNFYFVYSGSAFVQKEKVDEQTGKKQLVTENVIDQGACFGELALISDGGKRTATIICREPTEIFQIDRDSFEEICPNIFSAELEQKIKVAMLNPMFQSLPSEIVTKICFQAHIKTIPYGKVIEKDWSKASHVYFVIRGSIKLLKTFTIPQIDETLVDFQMDGMPRPLALPRYTETESVRFASVGDLRHGDHSDLRVLTEDTYKIPHVIMVSQGCEVLRMTVSMLHSLAGSANLQDYLENYYKPPQIPDQSQLYLQYIKESTWEEFKGSVVKSLKSSKDWGTKMGAASEGRSNWTRWPPHQAKSYSSWTKWPPHQIQSYSTSTRLGTAATCFSLLSDKSCGITSRVYSPSSSSTHHQRQASSRIPEPTPRVTARDIIGQRGQMRRIKPK